MSTTPIRGHVYRMHDPEYGTLFCLIITTEPSHLYPESCVAARVTVTPERRYFPLWVRLGPGDPTSGYVAVDDFDRVDYEELKEDIGEVTFETMTEVCKTLKRYLGL